MKVRCPECGAEIQAGHRFCDCGHEVTAKEIESFRRKKRSNAKPIAVLLCLIVFVAAAVFGGISLLGGKKDAGTSSNGNANQNTPAVSNPIVVHNVTRSPSAVPRTPSPVPTATQTPTLRVSTVSNTQPTSRQLSYGPQSSVTTNEDLADLLQEMFEYGYDKVELGRLNVPDIHEVFSSFGSCESYFLIGNRIEIEWRPGVRIVHAHKNGNIALLSSTDKQIYDRARGIVNSHIQAGMSDLEKETALHDYIIYNCNYGINSDQQTDSVYGFFNYGKCQCSGYADTFYLLGSLAGLDIRTISGVVLEGNESHAWNLIKLDGKWYVVDVTHDDPVGGHAEHHAYLNVPVSFFNGLRTWDSWAMPEGLYAPILDDKWYYSDVPVVSALDEAVNVVADEIRRGNEIIVRVSNPSINLNALVQEVAKTSRCSVSMVSFFDEQSIRIVKFSRN